MSTVHSEAGTLPKGYETLGPFEWETVLRTLQEAGFVGRKGDDVSSYVADVETLSREWQPLQGALLPVEYLGKGFHACLHVRAPGEGEAASRPVHLWDIAADLGEQCFVQLAENLQDYIQARLNGLDPVSLSTDLRSSQSEQFLKHLTQGLKNFDRYSAWFQQRSRRVGGKAFSHEEETWLPKFDDWKPVRFCVHDHLMGLLFYSYDRFGDAVDVAGFLTRDHTNYARASATRGLLLTCLAEWARQGGTGIIRFVMAPWKREPDVRLPREIGLYCHLLGIPVKWRPALLSAEICRSLFTCLTPLAEDTKTVSSDKASLLIHRGVWSPLQVEQLIRFCPLAEELFQGRIRPGEQVRFQLVSAHCCTALLQEAFDRSIVLQSETVGGVDSSASKGIERELIPELPYAIRYRCPGFDVTLPSTSGEPLQIPAGQAFTAIFWAGLDSGAREAPLERWTSSGPLLTVVPFGYDLSLLPANSVNLIQSDLDVYELQRECLRRIREAGRIRS